MPTALSSTEGGSAGVRPVRRFLGESGRAVADVGHLVRFRAGTLPRRRTYPLVAGATAITVLAAALPAYAPGARTSERAFSVLLLMPSAWAGFLLLAVLAAVASGGGRELVPRDQAAPHPVGPATDHLGALLVAPLNTAWLLQAWMLLGATAYAVGPRWLVLGQLVLLLWIAIATALAQAVAWAVEALRRGPRGVLVTRVAVAVLALGAVALQLGGGLDDALDRVPTLALVVAVASVDAGPGPRLAVTLAVEALLLAAAVALGAWPARAAARRVPHDESRAETGRRGVRPAPRSDLAAVVRLDRASVWRAVPMRRGTAVLAVAPGVIALAGALSWDVLTVLPGLVASGGALLFGVNVWCLDGRGALWRESLPASPGVQFAARAWVLGEWLLGASAVTLVLASLRAGAPTPAELSALLCTWVVVTAQVVAASMRWSRLRPFAVDLRSARATPAPPVVMVGYSARLALSTTLTGLLLGALGGFGAWWPVVFAVPLLLFAARRLAASWRAWGDPVDRARVVTAVSA